MASSKPPGVRYATRYCALLKRDVEVVLTKQVDEGWVLTACGEKDRQCAGHECPLRLSDGQASLETFWW